MGRKHGQEATHADAKAPEEDHPTRRRFLYGIAAIAGLAVGTGLCWYQNRKGATAGHDATNAALKEPANQPAQRITETLAGFTHPDVKEVVVYRHGSKPIIFIPWLHPLTTTQGNQNTETTIACMRRVRGITQALYDMGITGIVPEGLNDEDCKKVMHGGDVLDGLANKSDDYTMEFGRMLKERTWIIRGSNKEGIDNPMLKLKYAAYRNLDERCREFQARGWANSIDAVAPHTKEIAEDLSRTVFAPYARSLEQYLAGDPGARKAFAEQEARDDGFIEAADCCLQKAPGCLVCVGVSHEHHLLELLSKTTHAYAVVRPVGVATYDLSDDERRFAWLKESVAFGKNMQVHGKGFTLNIETGLEDAYQRLGIWPAGK
jgi:hypothetical protein